MMDPSTITQYVKDKLSTGDIYLSGPMRGYDDHNYPLFHQVARFLRCQNLTVWSPAEHECETIEANFRLDFQMLASSGITSVVLLPGWTESEGATMEARMAQLMGIPCFEMRDPHNFPGVIIPLCGKAVTCV